MMGDILGTRFALLNSCTSSRNTAKKNTIFFIEEVQATPLNRYFSTL